MELNRDQIIKALECCVTEKPCRECPLLTLTDDPDKCKRELMKHAIAHIRGFNGERLRELLTIAKDDILWLILRRKFDMGKLNAKGNVALFVMNGKVSDEKIDEDFGAICDYLEGGE